MRDILVVGNGYDLAKGLNTRFVDFFYPVVKRYIEWLDYKHYTINLLPFALDYKNVLYESIKKKVKSEVNLKYGNYFLSNVFVITLINKYFPFVNILNILIEINPQLVSPSGMEALINQNSFSNSENFRDKSLEYIKVTVNYLRDLISSGDSDIDILWMDIESTIKEIITDNLSVRESDLPQTIDWHKFFSTLYGFKKSLSLHTINYMDNSDFRNVSYKDCFKGLTLFKEEFCLYLSEEVARYEEKRKLIAQNDFILPSIFTHAISLNYTSIFKESLLSFNSGKSDLGNCICHVHGDISTRNIVIGTESFYFDENSREENNINRIPFFKFFQKVLYQTDDKYLHWIDGENDFSLTFFGFSFSQNDYDFIRELFISDKYNDSSKNKGDLRNGLKEVTIYCKEEKDKFYYLVNLAACLGKKHLSSLKNILRLVPIEPKKSDYIRLY